LDLIADISGLRYVGVISRIEKGKIRLISTTYLILAYLCSGANTYKIR